jgi:hypothetical protein
MKRGLSLALSGALLLAVLAAPVLTRAADKPGIAVLEFQGRGIPSAGTKPVPSPPRIRSSLS